MREIEAVFNRVISSLGMNIILDKIEYLPEQLKYCLVCHDHGGQLPTIEIQYSDDDEYIFDRVSLYLERCCTDVGY